MPLTMVNPNAEVIVVRYSRYINFCPNMVRFRIRPDCFGRFFFFFNCYFCLLVFHFFLLLSLLLYKLNLKLCFILEICLFPMLSNEI